MVRYLFHVMSDGYFYRDEVGRRFDHLDDAKAHAAVIARELAMDGDAYHGFAVCVIDDRGTEVARVPVDKDSS
jgi:hypothetical protein